MLRDRSRDCERLFLFDLRCVTWWLSLERDPMASMAISLKMDFRNMRRKEKQLHNKYIPI